MQLSPLQLEIQQRADKTLSLGCLIRSERFDGVKNSVYISEDRAYKDLCSIMTCFDLYTTSGVNKDQIVEIIGHPMTRGRLCYLYFNQKKKDNYDPRCILHNTMSLKYKECYQQTVLERPLELKKLVLKFLLTLPKDV